MAQHEPEQRDAGAHHLPQGRCTAGGLLGALADWCDARGLAAHVSVSDESDYATSYVVVEQQAGDRQAQDRVAEEFEALVVIGAEAAMPQRTLEQALVREAMAEPLLQCGETSIHGETLEATISLSSFPGI